uniref:Uncharacterized protein n=1 Tax=Wuchereria bancrofti TaxID=6293 RepID=A0AAF5Q7E2_WUCBA
MEKICGAVSGIWALKLMDNEHKNESRIKKHGFTLFDIHFNDHHHRETVTVILLRILYTNVNESSQFKISLDQGKYAIIQKPELLPMHVADNMTQCFWECPRRGISIITSQLDTVPEKSSKSTKKKRNSSIENSLSRRSMSSRASINSPSSIPSPINQCIKARFEYIRSNLTFKRAHASAIAVVLANMQRARGTGAALSPGTAVGGSWLTPI